jgi:hypothetical protein
MAELFCNPLMTYKRGNTQAQLSNLQTVCHEQHIVGNRDTTNKKTKVPPGNGELGPEFTPDHNIQHFDLTVKECKSKDGVIFDKFGLSVEGNNLEVWEYICSNEYKKADDDTTGKLNYGQLQEDQGKAPQEALWPQEHV